MDIKNLSLKELNALKISIDKEIKRKQYKYNLTLKPINIINYTRLGEKVDKYFNNNTALALSSFNLMKNSVSTVLPLNYSAIYTCPKCGRPMSYFSYNNSLLDCTNSDCTFCLAFKSDNEKDCWKKFHEWLQEEGYLSADIEFQE